MSTDVGGRPVLRPGGNVARATLRKTTKPPPSPLKTHLPPPLSSQPSTPETVLPSSARTPLLKFLSPGKLSPKKPPSPSPVPLSQADEDLHPQTSLPSASNGLVADTCDIVSSCGLSEDRTSVVDDSSMSSTRSATATDRLQSHLSGSPLVIGSGKGSSHRVSSSAKLSKNGHEPISAEAKTSMTGLKLSGHPLVLKTHKSINSHISLNKSTSAVFEKGPTSLVKAKQSAKKSLDQWGTLSFDESSLTTMVAAKKAAATEINAQRKLKVSEYGRKQGKASRIAPDVSTSLLSSPLELKRCKFITTQSDPLYVAYHDEEWGVPVHDNRMLFELLVLAGFQVELSWTTILHNREAYRDAFAGFEPSAIASFKEKHIQSLETDKSLVLPSGKLRGVIDNAQRVLEVVHEFGSLDEYMWGFLNKQPMVNNYRYPKQVPVKTSKSELISKDLVRRGFRFVGPTIIYSFMQASGMTNDHLMQCYRYQECAKLSRPSESQHEERQAIGRLHADDCGELILQREGVTLEES